MYDKSQLMRGTLEGCILKIKCEALRQNNKRKPIHQKLRHEHTCWMHCV